MDIFKKALLFFFLLALAASFSKAITLEELKSSYDFSYSGAEMNITDVSYFGNDANNNSLYDYLIVNITTISQDGTYAFVGDMHYAGKYIASANASTYLSAGTNIVQLYFNPKLLAKDKYNLSIVVYKDDVAVYRNSDASAVFFNKTLYEKPDVSLNVTSYSAPDNKTLRVNAIVNASHDGIYEINAYLTDNTSTAMSKSNYTLINGTNPIQINFNGSEIRKKRLNNPVLYSITVKDDSLNYEFDLDYPLNYNLYSFDAGQTILADAYSIGLLDLNSNNLSDFLVINISVDVKEAGAYTLETALYDSYNNYVKQVTQTTNLNPGMQAAEIKINGTFIYTSKINGPYVLNYVQLMKNSTILDYVVEPYIINVSSYSDFERPLLPDLEISESDVKVNMVGNNANLIVTANNPGTAAAYAVILSIFDENYAKADERLLSYIEPNKAINASVDGIDVSNTSLLYLLLDIEDIVEEGDESNNQIVIYLKRPTLKHIENINVNEGALVEIIANATDPNNDPLIYYINDSRFNKINNSTFRWQTQAGDAGSYVVDVTVSDGAYNHSQNVDIEVSGFEGFNLSLSQSWNLISFPMNITNKSISSIFKNANVSSIFAYNSSWLYYFNETKNNFNTAEETRGLWVKSLNNKTLSIQGYAFSYPVKFNLNKGWNLISYPSLNISLVNKSLKNVNFSSVFGYDNVNKKWLSYNKNKPTQSNTLKNLTPGSGYWVNVNKDANWSFNGSAFISP